MGLCFCYHSMLQIVSVWCSGEYWQNFRICCGISICALIVSILIGIGIKSRSWRGGSWQLKCSELSVGLSSRVDWEGKINTSITSRKNCLTGSRKGSGPGIYSQTRCSSDRGVSGFALFLPLICVPVTWMSQTGAALFCSTWGFSPVTGRDGNLGNCRVRTVQSCV